MEDDFDSDEMFAFIVDYTEGGAPIGITHEEWDKTENLNRVPPDLLNNEVMIKLPKSTTKLIRQLDHNQPLENLVQYSIAITLYVSKSLSLSEAATVAGLNFTDFINLLTSNHIPWNTDLEDSHFDHQSSLQSLIFEEASYNHKEE